MEEINIVESITSGAPAVSMPSTARGVDWITCGTPAVSMPSAARDVGWIVAQLTALYPIPQPELNFTNPYETLIAALLSAHTTDKAVNAATEVLFAQYPDIASLSRADVPDVERIIKRVGLYRAKAKHAVAACAAIMLSHNGEVPRDFDALVSLPGVGRKVANVVLANAFGIPAFAVDTHIHRVANRLGLASSKTPRGTEESLTAIIPPELWRDTHHRIIFHGRRVCHARKPACGECPLAPACAYFADNIVGNSE